MLLLMRDGTARCINQGTTICEVGIWRVQIEASDIVGQDEEKFLAWLQESVLPRVVSVMSSDPFPHVTNISAPSDPFLHASEFRGDE